MKLFFSISVFLISLALFSSNAHCQTAEITSDTNEFDYLIGVKYKDVSELVGLEFKTRTAMMKDDILTASTVFKKNNFQIFTSEVVNIDPESGQRVYWIKDIIILNGNFAHCGGCLVTKNPNIEIESFHPLKVKKKGSVLLAYEKNRTTGKFTLVNHKKYDWNPNADKLEKY